jgi:hypothetical protein
MTRSPVAYLVFNRPQQTQRTFAAIRAQQPRRLYVIADGPRVGHPSDARRCAEVRRIVSQVDWPCEVQYQFAEVNLGCKVRVSSGLNWVFQHTERAIVLEDDCLPHHDFFTFCDDLLDRYADDTRVWVITGNNFQNGRHRGQGSYYFSKFNHCWGWASWRRAWSQYRRELDFWPQWKQSRDWADWIADPVERRHWEKLFDRAHRGEIDTWDLQWTASIWHSHGLTATPNVNLVSNIGFGADATHTTTEGSENAEIPVRPLGELLHPDQVCLDQDADRFTFDNALGGRHHRWPGCMLARPRRWWRSIYKRCIGPRR